MTPEHTIGIIEPGNRNLLIEGDATSALTALTIDPRYTGQVKLAYLDPPFNTGRRFGAYDDAFTHDDWSDLITGVLEGTHRQLTDDGSLWLHLPVAVSHHGRAIADRVFGADNFVTEIAWRKTSSTRNNGNRITTSHDSIAVYRKSPAFRPCPVDYPVDRGVTRDGDSVPWVSTDPTGPGAIDSPGCVYAVQSPFTGELVYPRPGRHWSLGRARMAAAMAPWADYQWRDIDDEATRVSLAGLPAGTPLAGSPALMLTQPLEVANRRATATRAAGCWPEMFWTSTFTLRRKSRVNQSLPPDSWWADGGTNTIAKREITTLVPGRTPFDTPKPEALLAKILTIGTQPGDLVLDPFAGSGTTAAVAHKMGRDWVAIETSRRTIETFILPRLRAVIDGQDPGGASTLTRLVALGRLPRDVTAAQAAEFVRVLGKMAHGQTGVDPATIALLRSVAATKDETQSQWTGGGGLRFVSL